MFPTTDPVFFGGTRKKKTENHGYNSVPPVHTPRNTLISLFQMPPAWRRGMLMAISAQPSHMISNTQTDSEILLTWHDMDTVA